MAVHAFDDRASQLAAALAIVVTWGLAGRPGSAEDQASRTVDYVLREDAIQRAEVVHDHDRYRVQVELNGEETRRLAQVTGTHVGEELRVLFHGDLLAHPLIVDEVTNGRLSIGSWTSENEARTLALRLKPVRGSGP